MAHHTLFIYGNNKTKTVMSFDTNGNEILDGTLTTKGTAVFRTGSSSALTSLRLEIGHHHLL